MGEKKESPRPAKKREQMTHHDAVRSGYTMGCADSLLMRLAFVGDKPGQVTALAVTMLDKAILSHALKAMRNQISMGDYPRESLEGPGGGVCETMATDS